jgi:hypothetical protein
VTEPAWQQARLIPTSGINGAQEQVPCLRSFRRVAVRAVSSFSAHSWSVLVSPHTWLEVRPRSRSTVRNGWPP